jgi:ankyrin repeat protein
VTNLLYVCRYSTPLHDAVCCGRQEIVQILVERGANVNELDYKNMTPLKLAVRWGHMHMHSCNMQVIFVRYGQDDIEELLRSKGAKETVEIPKKVSVVGEVDPPWVRKSSRREPAVA